MDALKILVVETPEQPIKQPILKMNFQRMENHLEALDISCSERFRFQSFDSLRRLLRAFQFPLGDVKLHKGYKSTAEEIILISLTRLCFPSRWTDIYERFPGRKSWFLSAAFMWFLDFMIDNWAYLLVNNLIWWYPRFAESCEQGPNARPLPPNCIFSPDYDPELGDEINYDSDDNEFDLNDSGDDSSDDDD
jgi:hypothetical protein